MQAANHNPLATYLKDRRAKLDPARLWLSLARRRTSGLRREESGTARQCQHHLIHMAGAGLGWRAAVN